MYELQRCPTTLIPLSIVNDGYWWGVVVSPIAWCPHDNAGTRRLARRLKGCTGLENRSSRQSSFTEGVEISDDALGPCRQTPNLAVGHFAALLRFSLTG